MSGSTDSCSDWRVWLFLNKMEVRVRAWLFKMEC
jgi:hypothetical protein